MKAFILAAGRGSRMQELTEINPKCFTILGDIPLIQWQADSLFSGGATKLTVVTGYKSDSFKTLPYSTIYNDQWSKTNMISSLLLALRNAHSSVIVSYSDIVYDSAIVSALFNSSEQHDITVAYDPKWLDLWNKRFSDPLTDAESFEFDHKNILTDIRRRLNSSDSIMGQFIGLFKINSHFIPRLTKLISDNKHIVKDYDTTALFRHLIDLGYKIKCVPMDSYWCEIDSKSDLKIAQAMLAEGKLCSVHS